ncbi:MAG: putative metallopeptidase [Candidatus Methanomethylicia archaeon]|jgi:predicted metallopeptidase|nr:putative metallopeptidase [Candidatus Methanomethylicia archaeon]
MPITYMPAEDVRELVKELVSTLSLSHINIEHVMCFRSKGSRSRRGIARCYALSKIWQRALNLPPHYIIEVISERFDSLSEENKIRVIIHELLHIPKAFGGGLRPHQGYVTKKLVEEHYCRFIALSNRKCR